MHLDTSKLEKQESRMAAESVDIGGNLDQMPLYCAYSEHAKLVQDVRRWGIQDLYCLWLLIARLCPQRRGVGYMAEVPESGAQAQQTLRLLVKGFAGFDLRLLEGAVKLSKRRNPSLELVDDSALSAVDVVMLDGKDAQALVWAQQHQEWLAKQAVVWVDAQHAPSNGHTALHRPVHWTNLPVILSRAMDEAAYSTQAAAPASQDAAAQQAVAVGQTVPEPVGSPIILVVDDSAAVRGHLDSALKAVGYNVHAVDSGEAALLALDSGERYACILMDVLMPGMDGYDTCRRIKSMARAGRGGVLPIVMLTSKSSPFDKIRGKMAGCDAYLTKPVQKSHLMQVLAQFVFKSRAVTTA